MRYIVDTHTLIWYFTKDQRLSGKAKQIIQEAEQGRNELIIPVIVLLEAIDIQEKKRINFEINELFDFIEAHDNFLVADLNFPQAKEIVGVGRGLDLHDRVIVLVANIFQAVVLTKDPEIKKASETIW